MTLLGCPLCCNQDFTSVIALQEHLLYFTYRPLRCGVCQISVAGIQELTHHLEKHLIYHTTIFNKPHNDLTRFSKGIDRLTAGQEPESCSSYSAEESNSQLREFDYKLLENSHEKKSLDNTNQHEKEYHKSNLENQESKNLNLNENEIRVIEPIPNKSVLEPITDYVNYEKDTNNKITNNLIKENIHHLRENFTHNLRSKINLNDSLRNPLENERPLEYVVKSINSSESNKYVEQDGSHIIESNYGKKDNSKCCEEYTQKDINFTSSITSSSAYYNYSRSPANTGFLSPLSSHSNDGKF